MTDHDFGAVQAQCIGDYLAARMAEPETVQREPVLCARYGPVVTLFVCPGEWWRWN